MTKKSKNMSPRVARSLMAMAVAGALFPIHASIAQEVKPAEDAKVKPGQQLETVIVTAQRRSENIKEVPMAISTLKGEQLDILGSSGQDIRFLAGRVPSLNVESDYGRSFPRFYIRGLGNTDFDLNASQPVGLVFDDVVQESPMLKGFPIFDVDQIEVLRGPQGTLFGRNSPAGVVKFESAKPTQKVEGYFNFGVGSFRATNLEGAYNLPLNQNWAARFSLQSQQRNDRVFNDRPNAPTTSFEGYDDTAGRVQLLYKVSDFSALFNVHARDMTGNATLFRANIIKPGTNELVDNFRYNYYPTDGGNLQTLKTTGGSLRLKWSVSDLTLHSITAYESAKFYSYGDVDGGFGAAFALPSGPGRIPFPAETADGLPDHKQLTQEFRIESNYKGPLQWIGGLYAFKEDITVESFNFESLNRNRQFGYAVQHQNSRAWAAFGSINYAVSEQLKLRAGLRYTNDRKQFDATRTVDPFGGRAIGPLRANPNATNTSWDLSATYALSPETNLYSRVATGYRAPSIQGRILFGDTISVANSEKALSFEAGVKRDFFNKRARVSFSVFQYRVNDLQLTAGSGTVNQNRLVNAKKATGQGAEIDFQALLTDDLRVTLGVGFNDTEIKDPGLFIRPCGAPCTVLNPRGSAAGTVLINGNPLPRAPRVTSNFTLRYSRPVGGGEVFVFTDWAYRSTYNMFLYRSTEFTAKSLLEGGLRIGYLWSDGKYEAALFARNITDRQQVIAAIDFNNLTGIVNEPRSIGAQFKMNF